jgi:hypothetical protein
MGDNADVGDTGDREPHAANAEVAIASATVRNPVTTARETVARPRLTRATDGRSRANYISG